MIVVLTGCGSASPKAARLPDLEDARNHGAQVVRVAGAGGVSRSAVEHWIAVQAATNYNSRPSRPTPAGVAPDPPLYNKCIVQLRTEPIGVNPQTPNKPRPKPTDANLKKECEAKYEMLRRHVLIILTSFQWLAGESAERGIRVSDDEVRRELERFRKEQIGSKVAFEAYMRDTFQTYEDELLRMRMDLYSNALQRLAGKRAHVTSKSATVEAYLRTLAETGRRWASRTTCAPDYVTQNCSNYKGTLEPELRI